MFQRSGRHTWGPDVHPLMQSTLRLAQLDHATGAAPPPVLAVPTPVPGRGPLQPIS